MVLWDFMNDLQADAYDYHDQVYDATCKRYVPRTLSYLEWLRGVMVQEWNSINAITDPIPDFATAGSPSPWKDGASPNPAGPWPTFGDNDNELVLTGVKGWFGYDGLLGYRTSLEQLAREGMVFNYLQVEFRFRAPRGELDTLLKPFAHSIDQIFEDDYEGHRLGNRGQR